MDVGGRKILVDCKSSVNFLPKCPIALSENLPE